ncbi:MAG: hypothetical protein IJ655_02330 [Lachnospiraceae bacterium]|nr:hypothetical protein [Lachnospiraceae bacterium]
MNFNFMIVFDVIVTLLGIYLLFIGFRMRKDAKIPPSFVAKEEMVTCRDEAGFANFLFPRTMVFALTSLAFGIEGLVNDVIVSINPYVNVAMIIVFLMGWLWFSMGLRKGRGEYCGR